MRDKRFDCGAVLTVIKTYRYMVYVEIFVTVDCGTVRDGCYHSKSKLVLSSVFCLKSSD